MRGSAGRCAAVSLRSGGAPAAVTLWRGHRLECSTRSVQRPIESYRTQQVDIAKAVVREALRAHLLPALKRIALAIGRAREVEGAREGAPDRGRRASAAP